MLKFENKRPGNLNGQMLYMQSPSGTVAGQILDMSSARDTLERQEAVFSFKETEKNLWKTGPWTFR